MFWNDMYHSKGMSYLGKLRELLGGGAGKPSGDETGTKVEQADGYEPTVQDSV